MIRIASAILVCTSNLALLSTDLTRPGPWYLLTGNLAKNAIITKFFNDKSKICVHINTKMTDRRQYKIFYISKLERETPNYEMICEKSAGKWSKDWRIEKNCAEKKPEISILTPVIQYVL